MNPDVERGAQYQFQEGYPEVRVAAIGLLDEQDQAFINVTTEVVYGSLIYRTQDDVTFANVRLEIRINEKEGPYSKTFNEEFDILSSGQLFNSQEVFTYIKDLEVQPGSFEVSVTLTDTNSGKAFDISTDAVIPDPEDPQINITSVRLSGKNVQSDTSDFVPITTYDVASRIDSLKFDFQVTNNDLADPLTVNTTLMKFRADDSPARRLSSNNYSSSSIQYKGIEFRDTEEIDTNVRVLDQPGSVLIEFKYPILERGNYRFKVETTDQAGETILKARDFSVKGKNYPSIASAREMAEPLIYLMDDRRHEEMMSIEDPELLKEAVDRFWLSNVGNQNRAKSVISLYYERVEEANKQFSNFKEGWKTDMGMIYILFGPPWYVDRTLNLMEWTYSYDRDPNRTFRFESNRIPNADFPFAHYIVQRSQNYFTVVYQQTERWRSGRILEHRL